ncbi:trans-sialidase, putative, partial [Trypanosoma cruzi marinkellei]
MMAAAECTSPVTRGSRGRRHSGHFRACGAIQRNVRDLRRALGAGSSQRLLAMV